VVSGPSGVGKSSIVDAVMARTDAQFSVSATTRSARPGEEDGVDYHFVTRTQFERMREAGEILEWATYGGHLYGTPRSSVLPLLERGVDVILDIENEGAKQIKTAFPEAVLVFIAPPSLDELSRRLFGRGDTAPDDASRRLAIAGRQMEEADDVYDHIVVNDDLGVAIGDVLGILGATAAPKE
jgi:guanylate kinase